MVAIVTLHVNGCESGSALAGAAVTDGYNTVFTNSYGEIAVYWDDTVYAGYSVAISKSGYQTRQINIYNSQNGTTVTTCLNAVTGGGGGGGGTCFTGETRVTLADGREAAIASLRVGDRVLGRSGQPNRVISVDVVPLGGRKLFGFDGGPGFVTAEHPFMAESGWKAVSADAGLAARLGIEVGQLRPGDKMLTLQGCAVLAAAGGDDEAVEPVIAGRGLGHIDAHEADPATKVYNLFLDGDHTYFANRFLVHNKSSGCFIVTAATGSDTSDEVGALRRLRDEVAARAPAAGRLIDAIYAEYWQFSPALAQRIDGDALLKDGTLMAAVRPLLGWYRLAGALALGGDAAAARVELAAACPGWMQPGSVAALIGRIRREGAVPAEAPAMLQDLAAHFVRAASLPLIDWAILEPLETLWSTAARQSDPVAAVAAWLAAAPVAPMALTGGAEAAQVAELVGFDPAARRRLEERIGAGCAGCGRGSTLTGTAR